MSEENFLSYQGFQYWSVHGFCWLQKAGSISCWQMLKSERPGWDGKGPEDLSLTWLLSNCLSDKDVFSCSCKHTALRGLEAFIIACFWRGSCWLCARLSCQQGGLCCHGRRPACTLTWPALAPICGVVIRMGRASPCPVAIPATLLLLESPALGRGLGLGRAQNRNGKNIPRLHFCCCCFEVECSWNTLLNLVFSALCCQ